MLELPTWLHTLATALTLAGASVWLVVRWLRIGRPRSEPSCARCVRASPDPTPPGSGIRSARLRVLR